MSPRDTMLLHQYLYYVAALPVWTDYQYDMFCREHGMDGGGGSSREGDYPLHVIEEANRMLPA